MSFLSNPLDMFETYSYNIELYQLHPNDITDFKSALENGNRVRLVADNAAESRYNISRVEQIHAIGHGEARSSFGNKFDIQIIEPIGTTLLKQLRENAVSLGVPHPKDIKYLMVISFNGRDHTGKARTYPRKFYYPMVVGKFEFNINDGGTTYQLSAIEAGTQGLSYLENVLKNQLSFDAASVNEFISLMNQRIEESEQLNLEYNANAVYADEYIIELDDDIQDWGNWKFQQTEEELQVSGQSRVGLGADGKMSFSITNGSNITDLVGLALQCTEEYKKVPLHDGGYAREDGAHESSTTTLDHFKVFYKVITQVEYTNYDPLRGEYAKRITYRIIKHIVADEIIDSTEYLSSITDTSVQNARVNNLRNEGLLRKRYDYLYTGANTEVLDLDMKFDYAYFAVSVIGNGRFGDQNTVSAQAGQNATTPLEKLQQNKIELRDVQRQIADARTSLEGKLKSVANVFTDSIIRSAIQEDEEDITSLNSRSNELRNNQTELANTVKANLESAPGTDIDMRLQFSGDVVDDSDVYGPENDVLGGALNFAAVKTNLENAGDMITIELGIKGDPYWLGSPGGFNQEPASDLADYERGGQFLYLRVNVGTDEQSDGRRPPDADYQISALYRVLSVITNYQNGMFTQHLKCARDLGTNTSTIASTIENDTPVAIGTTGASAVQTTIDPGELQDQADNDGGPF